VGRAGVDRRASPPVAESEFDLYGVSIPLDAAITDVRGGKAIADGSVQMKFRTTKIPGVMEIDLQKISDERGFFARTWCQREFQNQGLNPKLVQCSTSFNLRSGTLRGMHYQNPPFAEAKLVRCTRGAIHDVVLDLRSESVTFRQWIAIRLSPADGKMIYIPEGCAHGFLTLQDETEVFYQMSQVYSPDAACGVRWNDPAFKIAWPGNINVISERDRTYCDFEGHE